MSAITEVKALPSELRRGRSALPTTDRRRLGPSRTLSSYTPFRAPGLEDEDDRRVRARVGTVLDEKWTLERLLGTGGMAAVYAARHRNGARAAVKILHPALARLKEVRERFQREGYAANSVEHVGVVKVLDDHVVQSGPDGGTAYLVMELLDGESLQDRIERGPALGELEYLRLAHEVLDVLREAHARGVIHRDLKPENLFLVREANAPGPEVGVGRVKVLDFGLARLHQGQPITTYGLALGTPSFMSPEQAAGRLDEIDGRTDLFALGATGFRLRTGRRIHEGANAVDLVRKMAQGPAPRIRSVAADVSEPFARVVDRALEFRREDRYATAKEMQSDVGRAIAQIESAAGDAGATDVSSAGARPAPLDRRSRADESAQGRTMQVSTGDLEPSADRSNAHRHPRSSARVASLLALLAGVAVSGTYALHLAARVPGVADPRWLTGWRAGGAASFAAPEASSLPAVGAPIAAGPVTAGTPAPNSSPHDAAFAGDGATFADGGAAFEPRFSSALRTEAEGGFDTRSASSTGAARASSPAGSAPLSTNAVHRAVPAKAAPTSSAKPPRKRTFSAAGHHP